MIDNSNWRVYDTKVMLNWKNSRVKDDIKVKLPPVRPIFWENHDPMPMSYWLPGFVWCVICGLKTSIWKSLGIQAVDTCDQSSHYMASCVNPSCDIIAHSHVPSDNKQMIFEAPEFVGLSCFQMAHDKLCTGFVSSSINNAGICNNQRYTKNYQQMKSTKNHIICNIIRTMYANVKSLHESNDNSYQINNQSVTLFYSCIFYKNVGLWLFKSDLNIIVQSFLVSFSADW